jgi:hypothetical protein
MRPTSLFTTALKALAVVLWAVIALILLWSLYSFFISSTPLVRIPFTYERFFAKQQTYGHSFPYGEYLLYMSERGYTHLPEERLGGLLTFERNGEKIALSHPKFIRVPFGRAVWKTDTMTEDELRAQVRLD